MYHAVGTAIRNDVRGLYNMSASRFEQHARLLVHGFGNRLVPLAPPALEGDSLRIAVTFDDGYRDNLTAAAPLLVELGVPFTVFVCTGAVADRRAGFLRPQDLRELAAFPGVVIGSHTVRHPRLTECDDRRLHAELADSKAYLEDLLGQSVDSVSYPHGAVDQRVRSAVQEAGYKLGASSRFDINLARRDPLLLCRTDIWARDDARVLEQKVRGDWDWMRWRAADPSSL